MLLEIKNIKIGIIGLGYVGLPLCIHFNREFESIGYDINSKRINELNKFIDKTNEVTSNDLKIAKKLGLKLTSEIKDLKGCNVYIITVPTPVDNNKVPNLNPLINASKSIGKIIERNDIIIYESTVYPGCTEEVCVPELEKSSGLIYNKDFFCGYSPERINPGDKINTLEKIKKVTSGSNQKTAKFIDKLYNKIIKAGTHLAPSIKIAETSKVIENAQRDINISFMNELSIICDKLNIDTLDVIEAASTKWNFIKLYPGLVGGHCISVDPYYLSYKSSMEGHIPEVILSGRRINEYMPKFISNKLTKNLIKRNIKIAGSNTLILGFSFKENCPDFRNTKVFDLYKELTSFEIKVDIFDEYVDKDEVHKEYKIKLIDDKDLYKKKYDSVILAVSHNNNLSINLDKLLKKNSIVFDLKGFLKRKNVTFRL